MSAYYTRMTIYYSANSVCGVQKRTQPICSVKYLDLYDTKLNYIHLQRDIYLYIFFWIVLETSVGYVCLRVFIPVVKVFNNKLFTVKFFHLWIRDWRDRLRIQKKKWFISGRSNFYMIQIIRLFINCSIYLLVCRWNVYVIDEK